MQLSIVVELAKWTSTEIQYFNIHLPIGPIKGLHMAAVRKCYIVTKKRYIVTPKNKTHKNQQKERIQIWTQGTVFI
jgi:hypothetical protein